ncbi:hypothetical protein AMTR_s00051p00204010 [Amborella trichopoda]|uniref:Uncharacterized protein n=1 Tax=Amborella trichopoda TaxID=13333 RepID=U5D8H8_AMBTC|nr:hypothetical protein AMTR_s00051p00204010 [Amborella trichopoda]
MAYSTEFQSVSDDAPLTEVTNRLVLLPKTTRTPGRSKRRSCKVPIDDTRPPTSEEGWDCPHISEQESDFTYTLEEESNFPDTPDQESNFLDASEKKRDFSDKQQLSCCSCM